MTAAERSELEQRSGLDRLRQDVENYRRAIAQDEIAKREYDFRFTLDRPRDEQLHEWQQTVDGALDHDVDQLDRRNNREERGFLRYIAKLDETIRDEEREEFKIQDEQLAHLKPDPTQWEKHKEAQDFEALRRQELRGIFYIGTIHDFIDAQTKRHEYRLEAVYAQNDHNLQQLETAYQGFGKRLDQVTQVMEEAREAIAGAELDMAEPLKRIAGMGRDEFAALVATGQELDRDNER